LLVVLLDQATFVSSYVGALHDPKPRDVQVGVVGLAPLAGAVARQAGFELVPQAAEAAARHAIDHRAIEGAARWWSHPAMSSKEVPCGRVR
jgi:hypothetical protein